MRWKIENEGFNQQKNGSEMEHFCNCNDFNVMRCLYPILRVAHMFMQLLSRNNLLDQSPNVLKHLARLLLESLHHHLLPEARPNCCLPNPKNTLLTFANQSHAVILRRWPRGTGCAGDGVFRDG